MQIILECYPLSGKKKLTIVINTAAALEYCFTLCYKCAFRGAQYEEKSATQEHIWSRSSLNILLGTEELGGAAMEIK